MLLSRSSFAASRAERLALHFKLGKQDGLACRIETSSHCPVLL
jgi:hypothetical protein